MRWTYLNSTACVGTSMYITGLGTRMALRRWFMLLGCLPWLRGGLALGHPEEASPTHFPVQGNFNPTVIDLMFVPMALSLTMEYEIHAEDRGRSDHAFLSIILPGPDSMVPATWWSIPKDSEEEVAYKAAVLTRLQPLLDWRGDSPAEIEEVVSAIGIFVKVWSDHAKESWLSSHLKGWWTDGCSDALAEF
jgi:hypothetical protein